MKNWVVISILSGMVFPLITHAITSAQGGLDDAAKERVEQCRQMKVAVESLLSEEGFYDSATIEAYRDKLEREYEGNLGITESLNLSNLDKMRLNADEYIKCAHFVSNYLTALDAKRFIYVRKLVRLGGYFLDEGDQRDDGLHAAVLEQLAVAHGALSKILDFENTWSSRDTFRRQINDYLKQIDIQVVWR